MSDDVFKQAADLYKQGDKEQACRLLSELVDIEPRNASAWYGLAVCLNDQDRKVDCLHKVLEINPEHQKAKQLLERLDTKVNPNFPEIIIKSEADMTDLDKYLNMLKSPKADTRYSACEELRVATKSSPEVILALEEATQDKDEYVAERAKKALESDVHLLMARKMGRYSPTAVGEIERTASDVYHPLTTPEISDGGGVDYFNTLIELQRTQNSILDAIKGQLIAIGFLLAVLLFIAFLIYNPIGQMRLY